MEFTVKLAGNKKVDALMGEFVIKTDQSVKNGGEGTAPEPYMLFLASIGTCAGVYVVGFCQARGIPFEDIEIVQRHEWQVVDRTHKLTKLEIEIKVPPEFPKKYHKALARAASSCAVKKTILDPPEFDVHTTVA